MNENKFSKTCDVTSIRINITIGINFMKFN